MQADRFTIKSQEALQAAIAVAASMNHTEALPEHLLVALIDQHESVVGPVLRKLGAAPGAIRQQTIDRLETFPTITAGAKEPSTSRELMDVLRLSEREAGKLNDEYISTEHILLAYTSSQAGEVARILASNGVNHKNLLEAIEQVRGPHRVTDQSPEDKYQSLQKFGRDLTQAAEDGKLDPVIGRDDEIRRVIQVLSRRTKNNPVLIGEPGVGKTAIVEGLAQRIVSGDIPESLRDRKVISLDIGALLAGSQVPRRVRGAPEGGPEGDRRRRGPGHPLHGRAAHDRRRRCRRGCGRRVQPAQADARPRRAARRRRDHARRVQEARREGRRAGAPLPADLRRRAVARGHDRDPARPQGALRGPPRRHDHRRGADRGRDPERPLHRGPLPPRQGDRPGRRGRLPRLASS